MPHDNGRAPWQGGASEAGGAAGRIDSSTLTIPRPGLAASRVGGRHAALDLLTQIEILACRDPLAAAHAARSLARHLEHRREYDENVLAHDGGGR